MTRHHPQPPPGGRRTLRRRDEKGAAAVEFALVILPLFLVLYGLITFGMMFALKQSLTNAASEGARSVVGVVDNTATPLVDERVVAANATVAQRLSWLGSKYVVSDSIPPAVAACAGNATKTCITVTVTYPYETKPLLPVAPLMDKFIPSSMTSEATVQLS